MIFRTPLLKSLSCSVVRAEGNTDTVNHVEFLSEKERRSVFESKAIKWDGMVRWPEFISGLNSWRKKLVKEAYGDVLEVAVGTGRNFKYYEPSRVLSVTGIDFARPMLETALKKKSNLRKSGSWFTRSGGLRRGEETTSGDKPSGEARDGESVERPKSDGRIPLRLVHGDCMQMKSFSDGQFDCVVDTFGICSFEDPVGVLREIARVVKQDGRILLLEHGESTWSFFKNYLNKHLKSHVELFGCYHNRDIIKLIKEAGLEICSIKRKHFGSVYLIICKVPEDKIVKERTDHLTV